MLVGICLSLALNEKASGQVAREMEWNEIAASDRALIQRQLGLDANGFPCEGPPTPPLNRTAPQELRVDDLTQSEVIRGCSAEILKAAPFWSHLRSIHSTYNRTPHVDSSKSTFRLVSAIPATVFRSFVIVWIESSISLSWSVRKEKMHETVIFESMHFVECKTKTSKEGGGEKGGSGGSSRRIAAC